MFQRGELPDLLRHFPEIQEISTLDLINTMFFFERNIEEVRQD